MIGLIIALLIVAIILILLMLITTHKSAVKKCSVKKSTGYEEKERKAKVKGELGEFKINFQLEQLPKEYKRIDDLLIKKKNGYSQIDHVVISKYGIFVIETKNYMGWIFGDDESRYWRQVNYKNKSSFYNPVWQNKGHVSALQELLWNYSKEIYFPIVVFSRRCEFKELKTKAVVFFDTEVTNYIINKNKKIVLNDNQVEDIFEILMRENITDDNIRQEHIQRIRAKK